ncbi:MAG: TRAP transporter substrate-binding protein DctP, partial [Planctomycetota bacterium]
AAFAAPAGAQTWRMSTKQPADSPDGKVFQRFADLVDQHSRGKFKIQVYPSEQLGKDDAVLEQLKMGTIHIYAEGAAYLQKWVPDAKWISAPFLFDDREHWVRFTNGPLVQGWIADARKVAGITVIGDLGAMVRWEESGERLRSHFGAPGERTIVTGFVARTHEGRVTTLGRNGSDYSGAIFAALFQARELHIWSDVEGVFSADPRLVPEAVLIDRLSYAEACELAYFGASVIHPQTMGPAFDRGIPIIARSTFHPTHPGTRISAEPGVLQPVKGVTAFKGLAILNIEGNGMIGVPGTAARAFDALHRAGVSVVMISQGSSEHSICCTIRESDAQAAERAVREAFARELAALQ